MADTVFICGIVALFVVFVFLQVGLWAINYRKDKTKFSPWRRRQAK